MARAAAYLVSDTMSVGGFHQSPPLLGRRHAAPRDVGAGRFLEAVRRDGSGCRVLGVGVLYLTSCSALAPSTASMPRLGCLQYLSVVGELSVSVIDRVT